MIPLRQFVILLLLGVLGIFVCSCATPSHNSELPAVVPMNPGAGTGNPLFVTISFGGTNYLFGVDTGASMSTLDKTLQSQLGPRRHAATLWRWGLREESGLYDAPRFFLNGVPLRKSGAYVFTTNLRDIFDGHQAVMGLIGMDVLKNYCVQLDFVAGQIRFLDDRHRDPREWGTPYRLHDVGDGCASIRDNLAGVKGLGSLIDTGCNYDGWLTAAIFQQWTNQTAATADAPAHFPDAALGGETYPHTFHLHRLDAQIPATGDLNMHANGIGLHTLSRSLVTFDFPHHTMYLKRVSVEPMVPESAGPALAIFEKMRSNGELPGLTKADAVPITTPAYLEPFYFPNARNVVVSFLDPDGLTVSHYSLHHRPQADTWTLGRAWRTDSSGRTVKEFSIPDLGGPGSLMDSLFEP